MDFFLLTSTTIMVGNDITAYYRIGGCCLVYLVHKKSSSLLYLFKGKYYVREFNTYLHLQC
jgi:hypothetical protein